MSAVLPVVINFNLNFCVYGFWITGFHAILVSKWLVFSDTLMKSFCINGTFILLQIPWQPPNLHRRMKQTSEGEQLGHYSQFSYLSLISKHTLWQGVQCKCNAMQDQLSLNETPKLFTLNTPTSSLSGNIACHFHCQWLWSQTLCFGKGR